MLRRESHYLGQRNHEIPKLLSKGETLLWLQHHLRFSVVFVHYGRGDGVESHFLYVLTRLYPHDWKILLTKPNPSQSGWPATCDFRAGRIDLSRHISYGTKSNRCHRLKHVYVGPFHCLWPSYSPEHVMFNG